MHLKKKILSGISLLLTVSMMAGCCKQPLPESNNLLIEKVSETNVSEDTGIIPEQFSVLTISKNTGDILADGYSAGRSFCGFTLHEDGTITVTVDGSELSFEEAAEKTGCTLSENSDGTIIVQSPFQKSQVVVKSYNKFDTYGAESVEETVKNHFLLTYSSPSEAYSAYKKLSENENIEFAEPNSVFCSAGYEETKRIGSWGLEKIGAREFCREVSEKNKDLPEIDVAVIDTGIYYEHSVFENRILGNGRNFCPDYSSKERYRAKDDQGHGSHCAGIICSSTNDNVKILPVKALDSSGRGDSYDIYCAIMYAIECNADIINMSLGGYGVSNLFIEAVSTAVDKGITVCVAAGNEYSANFDDYSSLSGIEECVVVSSVNSALNPSGFSNYQNIDFAAPGEYINSVSLSDPESSVMNSGTSMAAPFVTACFANVLSADNTLSSSDVYDIIKANAVDLCEPGYDDATGWGLVNLKNFQMSTERTEEPKKPEKDNFKSDQFIIDNGVLTECYASDTEILDLAELVEEKVIPEFSEIGDFVFSGSAYRKVILPDSVKKISDNAFKNCFRLKKIVTKAEYIGDSAFINCSALTEIDDSNIKEICGDAFNSCLSLEKADFKALTQIPESAFEKCRNLDAESFSFENITMICDNAFNESGLNGKVDLSSVEQIGLCSFRLTDIEEVRISDNITSLPEGVFSGCTRLRKIFAPAVVSISKEALALGKKRFSEDTLVETDINFSKVKYISDDSPFDGFVFSEPVSFDILDDVCMDSFDGAFGESLSLPFARNIYSDSIKMTYFNAMYFEQAEELELSNMIYSGVIGVGDGIKSVALNPNSEIWLYSLNDNPDVLEMFITEELPYHKSTELYKPVSENRISAFCPYSMYAVLPGQHLTYSYTVTFDTTGEKILSKDNSDIPVNFIPVLPGKYTLDFEIRDSSENTVDCQTIELSVSEMDVQSLKINEPMLLNNRTSGGRFEGYYDSIFSFTPEKEGKYKLFCSSKGIDIINEDGTFVPGNEEGTNTTTELVLKGGETYFAAVYPDESGKVYISVNSDDSSFVDISDMISNFCTIDYLTEPDGIHKISVSSEYGAELIEGKDYEYEISERGSGGFSTILIYGKGEYFGIFRNEHIFGQLAELNIPADAQSYIDYIPDKSGVYSVVFAPVKEEIEKAFDIEDDGMGYHTFFESCIEDFELNEEVSVFDSESNVMTSYEDYYSDNKIEYTGQSEFSVYFEKGVRYRIFNETYFDQYAVISDKPSLSQCRAEYSFSYQMTGDSVTPDIRLYDNGKLLEENRDYKLTVRKNTSPGLMFATAEGCGDYSGIRNFAMVIEGNGLKTVKYNGRDVIEAEPEEPFEYLNLLPYMITFERDALVSLTENKDLYYYAVFTDTDSELSEKRYVIDKDSKEGFIEKGSYFFELYNSDTKVTTSYRNRVTIFTDNTKKTISGSEIKIRYDKDGNPQITVLFEGRILSEGSDYMITEDKTDAGYVNAFIEGINDFTGKKEITYYLIPDAKENKILSNSERNQIDPRASVRYEWTAPAEKITFLSTLYTNSEIIITDEDGNYIWNDTVNKKISPEFKVEKGCKYYVYIISNFCEMIGLDIKAEGMLSYCTAEYDAMIPFSESREIPEVVFRDGDYVLKEGKDYTLLINGFIKDTGRREYVYKGCGKYFGDVTVPVVTYNETISNFNDFTSAKTGKNYYFSSDIFKGYSIGAHLRLKLTSSYEEKMLFHSRLIIPEESDREYINIFMYDSEGKFIGANDDVKDFELEKEQTVYIEIIPPYVNDTVKQDSAYGSRFYFSVEKPDIMTSASGDVNCDGKVNIFDLMRLNSFILGSGELSEQGKINAMISCSENRENPDLKDLMLLKKKILLAE